MEKIRRREIGDKETGDRRADRDVALGI